MTATALPPGATATPAPTRAPATTTAVTVRPQRHGGVDRTGLLMGLAAAGSALCLTWLLYEVILPFNGTPGFVVLWYVSFLALLWATVREARGRPAASDTVMTVVVATGALAMFVPLALVVGFVLYKGLGAIRPHFFTQSAEFCGQLDPATCGGVGHAVVGTLEQVGIGIVLSVPLAVLCAVFLNEIGGPLKRPIQLVVDAMSGVPSIVAGLFIYAVWVVGLQRGFTGFGASLALAILMLPTVTRTSVEVLRLVPDGLREGALALGASEWRTTWSVVLPTARSGLITAVILGVARAVGETAPLILTSFGSSVINRNPLSGPQEALPHYVYTYITFNPGTGPYQRAWSAALTLTFLVLALFTLARLVGARMSVESRQRRSARRLARRPEPTGGAIS